MKELAETIPLARQELATIAAEAGRFGVEGTENIENFTESVAKMSIATDLSATQAGEAFAKLSTLTETPIDSMENLGSSINSLSNNFATSSQEIVDSMLRSAGALSNLGLENTQITALSASLNEVSESSERAGTRLRRLAQELVNPKKVGDIASAFGVTVEEFERMRSESPTEVIREMARMMDEGGKQADALKNALSTTSRQALTGLSQNLDGLNSALSTSSESFEANTSLEEEFDAATSTLNSRIKTLRNRLRNVGITIGTQLLPYINSALDAVVPLIDRFAEFNERLDGLPGALALIGTTLAGLGALAVTVGPAIVGALAPIAVPIAAITAAIGVLWYAWQNNFGNIRKHVRRTIGILRSAFQSGSDEMRALGRVVDRLQKTFSVAMNAVEKVLKFVLQNFTIPLIKDLAKIWRNNFSEIASETKKTLTFIDGVTTRVLNALKRFWNAWGDEITTVVTTFLDGLRLLFRTAFRGILTTVKVILALLRGDFDQALTYIWQFWKTTLSDLVSYLKGSFFNGVKAGLTLLEAYLRGAFNRIKKIVMGAIRALVSESTSRINRWATGIKSILTGTFTDIKTSIEQTIDSLVDSVVGKIHSMAEDVASMLEGPIETINDLIDTIEDVSNTDIDIDVPSADDIIPDIPSGGNDAPDLGDDPAGHNSDTRNDLVDEGNVVGLATGGIVDSQMMAMIGEAGREAVIPLDKLSSYLDTAFASGVATNAQATQPATTPASGTQSVEHTVEARLSVEGDDELARLIRENAEIVVEEKEAEKEDRIARL
jgi:TP901 family phage tail tape measure protein